jgi:hypothetical protein
MSRYNIVTYYLVQFFLFEIENLKVTTSCAVFHFHLVAVYYLIYARAGCKNSFYQQSDVGTASTDTGAIRVSDFLRNSNYLGLGTGRIGDLGWQQNTKRVGLTCQLVGLVWLAG